MITQELIAYIRSELNKEKKEKDIRTALLASGGWTEADLNEAFRTIMPIKDATINPIQKDSQKSLASQIPLNSNLSPKPLTPQVAPNSNLPPTPPASPMLLESPISPLISPKKDKNHQTPWMAIGLAVLFAGLCFVAFFLYRSEIKALPDKIIGIFDFSVDKLSDSIQEEVTSTMNEKEAAINNEEGMTAMIEEKEIPETPEVVVMPPINCGVTNSPDGKIPNTYLNNDVLKCLGENAIICTNAEGTINDGLFPTFFKVINKDDICEFELSYKDESILCPMSIVKTVDDTNIKNPVFKIAKTDSPNKYITDIYSYGTRLLFIENNFDKNKIENLGCTGSFIDSVIEGHNLINSTI